MQLPAWIEWLDRRIGSWGVQHIIRILVVMNVASFVLDAFDRGFVATTLTLDPYKVVVEGEWWRIVTFLFASSFPDPTGSLIFIHVVFFVFGLLFLWNIGEALESEWGSFPLNLYILIPWLLLIGVALGPWPQAVSNYFIGASLLLAFASLYPDYEITILPIPIPIKIKWVGIVVAALAVFNFIADPQIRLEILAGFSGYLLFFSFYWFDEFKTRAQSKARMRRFKGQDRKD